MEETKVFQNKNAIQRFQTLYLCRDTADVHFLFPKFERIPAHKIILAVNSPVFRGMFYGRMKETGDIEIVDATPRAFEVFLKFFYFEEMVVSMENVGQIFYLAEKYGATECSTKCVEFLKEAMQIDNVCYVYELAILFNIKDLIQLCEKLISHETAAILKSEHFENCTQSTLQRVLLIDCFNCNEVTVFDACMHWATVECKRNNIPITTVNRMQQLGTCFNLIRFLSMDMDCFISCINSYPDLFEIDELEDIISHISNHRPLQSTTKFNPTRRHIWSVLRCNRLSTDSRHFISSVFDAVVFSANKSLLLEELSTQVITNHYSQAELSGSICIMNAFGVQLLQTFHFKNGIQNRIILKGPIIIEANKDYEIQIKLLANLGYKMFSVPKRLLDRVVIDKGIVIKFEKSLNSRNDYGLISDLFFKLKS